MKFLLASNKVRKTSCPMCERPGHWQRYIDPRDGSVLPEVYGRCDNEIKCGYWNKPKLTTDQSSFIGSDKGGVAHTARGCKELSQLNCSHEVPGMIPSYVLSHTIGNYEINTFHQALSGMQSANIEANIITQVFELYKIGTIRKGERKGACTFPFIGEDNVVRAIQAKHFNESCHTTSTDFLHSIMDRELNLLKRPRPGWLQHYWKSSSKVSCLFGEHLLNQYPENTIGLVEAPKTAIIATIYFGMPRNYGKLLWLSCFNLQGLTVKKCKVLEGRKIVLFPDLSNPPEGRETAFNLWKRKLRELRSAIPYATFKIDNFLEQNAALNERDAGADLADFLLQYDWSAFQKNSA